MSRRILFVLLLHAAAMASTGSIVAAGDDASAKASGRALRTLFVTRSLNHERLIPYLEEARPSIVQVGNYGAMFHGYADHEKSTGWPMMLPVRGERAALEFQRKLNAQIHELGLKAVGHFRLVKVMGHWDEQSGFVEYYNRNWPTDLLGPKPHAEVVELLQRGPDGKPIQLGRYNQSQLALCLSSPHTRQMLKQMLKVAVEQGLDGVNTNFNYHFGCVCPYCQQAFKTWLRKNRSPRQLRADLGIDSVDALEQHVFPAIPGRIPGYPDAESSTELDWLAARWAAEHFKQMFDEIFVDYGRSLKEDLIIAQWNHLGHVGIAEERAFLPLDMWGRDEDYFWYSGGASFVGKNLNLAEGKAGDAWLSCLYVRELSAGKPFVMGKYDRSRMAVSMAEGFANGGLGMGRYMRFEDPVGFKVLARYTKFANRHAGLLDSSTPLADVALVLPRQSVLHRRPESLQVFRHLGQALVERQVLLDVLADEKITSQRLAQYQAVILPHVVSLSNKQLTAIRDYADGGGQLLIHGEFASVDDRGHDRPAADVSAAVRIIAKTPNDAATEIQKRLLKGGATSIESPWTVRVAAYQHADQIVLHLVNYDREEGAPEDNRTGPSSERPRAVGEIPVNLRLPDGYKAHEIRLYAPDGRQSAVVGFREEAGRVKFTISHLRVYGVCAVKLNKR